MRLKQLWQWLVALRQNAQAPTLLRKAENLVTSSPIWRIRLYLEERRLEESLKKYGEHSFASKRQLERWRTMDLAHRYGRRPTPALKEIISRCRDKGMPEKDIRMLVMNRILRADGRFHISPTKETVLYVSGWVFVAICVVQFIQTAIFIWASPADVFLKVTTTAVCFTVFLFFGFLVCCYNILPFPAIKPFLRAKRRGK